MMAFDTYDIVGLVVLVFVCILLVVFCVSTYLDRGEKSYLVSCDTSLDVVDEKEDNDMLDVAKRARNIAMGDILGTGLIGGVDGNMGTLL